MSRFAVSVASLLTERCPRCLCAYDDFSGCYALSCASCGAAFCALCGGDCGVDAHDHVQSRCPFRGLPVVDHTLAAVRAARREAALWDLLDAAPYGGGVGAGGGAGGSAVGRPALLRRVAKQLAAAGLDGGRFARAADRPRGVQVVQARRAY